MEKQKTSRLRVILETESRHCRNVRCRIPSNLCKVDQKQGFLSADIATPWAFLVWDRLWSHLIYLGLIRSAYLELLRGQGLIPTCLNQVLLYRRYLASFVKCPQSEESNGNKSSKQNTIEHLSGSSGNIDAYEFAAFSLLSPL